MTQRWVWCKDRADYIPLKHSLCELRSLSCTRYYSLKLAILAHSHPLEDYLAICGPLTKS